MSEFEKILNDWGADSEKLQNQIDEQKSKVETLELNHIDNMAGFVIPQTSADRELTINCPNGDYMVIAITSGENPVTIGTVLGNKKYASNSGTYGIHVSSDKATMTISVKAYNNALIMWNGPKWRKITVS